MKSSWFKITLSVSDDRHKILLRGQQINFLPHKKLLKQNKGVFAFFILMQHS